MTNQLQGALRDLASDADGTAGAPPDDRIHDLWSRGRRARRRRTAGAVLAVAAVVLLGSTLPAVLPGPDVAPGPASYDASALAVPDTIWSPSSWLPEADEENPPGPLALVATAERREPWLLSTPEQWFAVSAVDGGYTWLDLPGAVMPGGGVALSPDGRQIGYYTGGNPTLGEPRSDVTGFAVYDTVTGEVTERPVDTRYGLAVDGITWTADGSRLVVSYGQWEGEEDLVVDSAAWAFDPGSGTSRVLTNGELVLDGLAPGGVAGATTAGFEVIDTRTGARTAYRVARGGRSSIARGVPLRNAMVSPSGTSVALVAGVELSDGTFSDALHAATLGPGDQVGTPRVIEWRWQVHRILGWLDDDRVLAEANRIGGYGDGLGLQYVEYDLRSGQLQPVLGMADPGNRAVFPLFAQDLLRRPFADTAPPPEPWHPWTGWALGGGVLLLVGTGAAVRRTRHRREERALHGRPAT